LEGVTSRLIAARCNIDLQDEKGCTPLHVAAGNGLAGNAKQLIAARCNIDLQDEIGASPLYYAVRHASVTKELIAARCNVDLQNTEGHAPLHLAADEGHSNVLKQLIAACCNVNIRGQSGATPLFVAVKSGHAAVTKQLIAARCDINLGVDGFTPLQMAQMLGRAGLVMLIRNQAKMQETPLLGRRVAIIGLVAKPEFNGRTGTALSFDDDKERYSVELDKCSSLMMLKPWNLLPEV
jgi:ankyrin repeat protein